MTRREGPRRRTPHLGAVTATGVIAAVAGLGAAAVGAASPGAASSPPAKIFACYSDATNDLFYLNYPKVTSCPAGQTLVSWFARGPQGALGAHGDAGARGNAGAEGRAGARGRAGSAGPQGPAGAQGPQGADGGAGPRGLGGARGATGARGAQGVTGAAGPQGPQGSSGARGPAGAQGPDGATGPQGASGGTGARGAQGVEGAFHPWIIDNANRQPLSGLFADSTSHVVGTISPASPGAYVVSAGVVASGTGAQATMQCFAAVKDAQSSTVVSMTPKGWVDTPVGEATMAGVMRVSRTHPTIEVVCRGSSDAGWNVTAVTLTATQVESVTLNGVRQPAGAAGARRGTATPRNLFANPAGSPKRFAGSRQGNR